MLEKIDKKCIFICAVCFSGILLRFWAMSFGHNYDFESYCIVGELAASLRNVYALTPRYNYGPVFFCIQGICFRLSQYFSGDSVLTYRILIVGILTLADLGIMCWIAAKYSLRLGAVFFLNPISVFITGYHNQFDNIAVLLALISCFFYNEEEAITKKDWLFVLFFTASLVTKHILFMVPFWLLVKKGLPLKKRILYSFVPPFVFLLSFVPFIIGNMAALRGVLLNVFLYRADSNYPLLKWLFVLLNLPFQLRFVTFLVIMTGLAFVVRKQTYEYQITFYLLAMVTFSSALANQYLVIPIVSLCIFSKGICRYIYFIFMTIYLFLTNNGLGLLEKYQGGLLHVLMLYHDHAFEIGVFILFVLVIKEIRQIYPSLRSGGTET